MATKSDLGPHSKPMPSSEEKFLQYTNNVRDLKGLNEVSIENRNERSPNDKSMERLFTAKPVLKSKEWQWWLLPSLRNQCVYKLGQAILPSPQRDTLLDKRVHRLVAYVQRAEAEVFQQANSKEEYYHLLAKKIYTLQRELALKAKERKKQKLQEEKNREQVASSVSRHKIRLWNKETSTGNKTIVTDEAEKNQNEIGSELSIVSKRLQLGQVKAIPIEDTPIWVEGIEMGMIEVRNHLVRKILKTINPKYDDQAVLDEKLIAYAQHAEHSCYLTAETRSQYYEMIAMKIYKIQSGLDENLKSLWYDLQYLV